MQEQNVQTATGTTGEERNPAQSKAAGRSSLPVPPTALVGRERELALARTILTDHRSRLLTLTGPGGVGKTRLSLEIAHTLADSFADGAAFVSLAPVNDPTLVVASIAAALGLREDSSSSLIERLKNALREKHRLLVLDNFEQVIAAAPLVVELLSAAPQLRVIVSSRAPLRVRGERELPLAPLALPGEQADGTVAESVSLFVQAASAVDPSFELTEENAQTIAGICIKLDGLPLAIELAAARVRLLPPAKLLARLQSRLALLTGGARDLPARQQTLRDAIAWSHDLLDGNERTVFRRLAAFTGGCTLEAAERVCQLEGEAGIDMLEVIGSLVEKSMLRRQVDQEGESRVGMLETIREYAVETLAASGEDEQVRKQHADYFAALTSEIAEHLGGGEQKRWLEALERDHDNLRAGIRWRLEHGDPAGALAMAEATGKFWQIRSYLTEGCRWLEGTLEAAPDAPVALRASALNKLGNLLNDLGELARAKENLERSLELYHRIGDRRSIAIVNNNLGNIALDHGEIARARELYEQSLAIRRELNDREGIAIVLNNLGIIVHFEGDFRKALELYDESLRIARELGNRRGELFSLVNIGIFHYTLKEYDTARALFEDALALGRELGDRRSSAVSLTHLGKVALGLGEVDEAFRLHQEGLEIHRELRDKNGISLALLNLGYTMQVRKSPLEAYDYFRESMLLDLEIGDQVGVGTALESIATLIAPAGEAVMAVELKGTADMIRENTGAGLAKEQDNEYDIALEGICARLDTAVWQEAWDRGRAMPLDEAVARAAGIDRSILERLGSAAVTEPRAEEQSAAAGLPPEPTDLTARELDVLRLAAEGLTDAEIGEKLFISVRTVNAHLRSVYGKLDVSSRKEASEKASVMRLI